MDNLKYDWLKDEFIISDLVKIQFRFETKVICF